jgi:hypothetical protein
MGSIKVETKTLDKGLERLRKRIEALAESDSYAKAGVIGAKAKEDHPDEEHGGKVLNNAQLAAIHEFGTRDGRIPERPFLRGTFRRNRESYRGFLLQVTRDGVVRGKISLKEALGLLGLKMQADIRNTIQHSIDLVPNAESTMIRKLKLSTRGSVSMPRPLIDTGRLLGSITYEVVMGPKDLASGKSFITGDKK